MADFFIGVDGGGTHTRAVVAGADLVPKGRGSAGPANAATRPLPRVLAAVTEAVAATLPNWNTHATASRPGHWLLDLSGVNRALLEDAGVFPDRIEDVGLCTGCRNDLFFSHRAEKGRTGRMMNFILLEADR